MDILTVEQVKKKKKNIDDRNKYFSCYYYDSPKKRLVSKSICFFIFILLGLKYRAAIYPADCFYLLLL